MRIKNLSEHEREIAHVSGFGVIVAAGATVDVPDEVGLSLVEQVDVWAAANTPAKKSSSTVSEED